MKINPGWRPINQDPLRNESSQINTSISRPFSGYLHEERVTATQEELTRKMEQIHRQGERLLRSMSIRDLREYKTLIKRFLEDTARKGVGIRDTMGWDRRGRNKRYQLLEEIDKMLVSMADELLETEAGKIELLAKVGDLRGMLINLFF